MIVFDNKVTRLVQGDCRDVLTLLPAQSVHMVVTSPPYWGLRSYQAATPTQWGNCAANSARYCLNDATPCPNGMCDGWKGVLGSEPTPEMYVAHIVEVFRAVKRVLRDDGTLWLNLGPTWYGSGGAGGDYAENGLRAGQPEWKQGPKQPPRGHQADRNGERSRPGVWQSKCMVPIPWMVGLALIADGWILRSEIIWAKSSPMPESVRDRPVKAHEQILLLVKSQRYYFDMDAVREPTTTNHPTGTVGVFHDHENDAERGQRIAVKMNNPNGAAIRSVWRIASENHSDLKHYAKYPMGLPRRCILAGTSERGCCPECGAQWERQVEKSGGSTGQSWHDHESDGIRGQRVTDPASKGGHGYKVETTGWAATCDHGLPPMPVTVLDPFAGTATTLAVAQELGRRSIGIELSPDYAAMAAKRLGKVPMAFAGA